MKKIIVACLLLLSVLTISTFSFAEEQYLELGNPHSEQAWVYLSGLTKHFNTDQELENRRCLDTIGRHRGVKFLALRPSVRCEKFNGMLCWPHHTQQEALETWEGIRNACIGQRVVGFIGFSNGGFFLNKLAQLLPLKVPIISIGSAGYIDEARFENKIFLLIGKEDQHHYQLAKQFYEQAKATSLDVELVEYNAGHVFPKEPVERLIQKVEEECSN